MGSIAIVGLGKGYDTNAAPVSEYGDLYNALGGDGGRQSLTSGFIIINAAGETIPYSTQLHTQFSPAQIADHVNKGGIWIDYTGWPMYRQADAQGSLTTLTSTGWSQFVNDLGPAPAHYGWLAKANFSVPFGSVFVPGSSYPFVRGFPLDESLDGVCYPDIRLSFPVSLGTSPSTADGFTSMVSIHPPGKGWYFYATWTPFADVFATGRSQGVPIADFANFITQVLQGNTGDLICQPYKTNTQASAPTSTGQSSPTTVSSSPGPSGSTTTTTTSSSQSGSSGASGTVTTTTQCPSGYTLVNGVCQSTISSSAAPTWVKPAIGMGLIAAGIGGFYYAGKHEGWWTNGKPKTKAE